MKRGISLIALLLLAGCATNQPKQVKVIRTEGEATIKQIQVDNGDVILCDKDGCKVINP